MAEPEAETQAPAVCVLIVSHNCEAALRACLRELERCQERSWLEVLVVDNGSRDSSAAMDEEFAWITMLRLPRNFGLTRARNIGIRTAKAEYLLLLAPDVLIEPETIRLLTAALEQDPSALAVCPLIVDAQGEAVSRAWHLPSPEQVRSLWREPYSAPGAPLDAGRQPQSVELHDGTALLMRKQTIQGIHYLDEKYGQGWIDAELAWQIRRAGRKILLVPDARARQNPEAALWKPATAAERALLDADAASGAARYLAKTAGTGAALRLRLGLALGLLFKLFTFTDLQYKIGLLSGLLSNSRIDGADYRL